MAFDPEKPVQTRDGRKARILCADLKDDYHNIVAAVQDINGDEDVHEYTNCGFWNSAKDECGLDLVNIPEKRVYERWVNVYPSNTLGYYTRKNADDNADHDRIACIHIKQEYTPGEGLEPAE